METGIGYYPSHYGVPPDLLAELVEQRGHSSLFFSDHPHLPSGNLSRPPGGEFPTDPEKILAAHLYDLFVAMTMAAHATSRLRIGSGICLLIERDPIITAKAVASLDVLSGGRIEFGVGAGWNRQQIQNHGTDPRTRMAVLRERVEAMTAIWTQNVASYHGEHVDFDEIWSWPKPLQRPRPPVLIGGSGATVLDRVLDYGDGWIPNKVHEELPRVTELQRRAAQTGRGVVIYNMDTPADPHVLEKLATAGVTQALYWVYPSGRRQVERALDEFDSAIATFTGS